MKTVIWIFVVMLLVLHQDFWWWDDGTLLLGIVPVGLASHLGISLAAAALWGLAALYCWPESAEETESSTASTTEGGRG
jgi:hypothetical protein